MGELVCLKTARACATEKSPDPWVRDLEMDVSSIVGLLGDVQARASEADSFDVGRRQRLAEALTRIDAALGDAMRAVHHHDESISAEG